MKVMLIILVICIIIITIIICLTWILTSIVLKPKTSTCDEILDFSIKTGRFTREYYESLNQEKVEIKSSYGYLLKGVILENSFSKAKDNNTRIAVLCHGYSSSAISMAGYAEILLSLGFTCIMFDHRNHGDSDKLVTSMGYYERTDLITIIDYCYERYGYDIRLLTYGESMGAATVLSLLEIDDRPALTIADCGYSDLYELLKHQLKHVYHLPNIGILSIADVILYIRAGFHIKQVTPYKGVFKSKKPILFIHGSNDSFVPTSMSVNMSKAGEGVRELHLFNGAGHALSYITDPEEYKTIVTDFINKNY